MRHFNVEMWKKFMGRGLPRPIPTWTPLSTPHPTRRLQRLDTRAFGARLVPPRAKLVPLPSFTPATASTATAVVRPCAGGGAVAAYAVVAGRSYL